MMNRIWKALAASFIAVSASAYTIKETKSNTDLDLYTSPSGTPAKAVSVSGTSGFLAALFGLQVNTQTQLTGALSTPMLQVDKNLNGTMMLHRESADSGGATLEVLKRRSGFNVVTSGDRIGTLAFSAADGSAAREAASVIAEVDGVPGASNMPGRLIFRTNAGAVAPTERMRIDGAGRVSIGSGGAPNANHAFELYSSGSSEMAIVTGTASQGLINFSDGSDMAGAGRYAGRIRYDHTVNDMQFSTNSAERMRIESTGWVNFGTSTTAGITIGANSSGVTSPAIWYGATDNQMCNTTCTTEPALVNGASGICLGGWNGGTAVLCTDGSADRCLCIGLH